MASLPRRNVPPPMSTPASGANNAVMPVTSPAFSLATNNRSKSWGSLAGSLVVESFIVTLRQLLWVARPSLKSIVATRRASEEPKTMSESAARACKATRYSLVVLGSIRFERSGHPDESADEEAKSHSRHAEEQAPDHA